MKKIFSVLAIVSLVLLASCGGKKSDNPLVGEWKFAKLELAKIEEPTPTGDSLADTLANAVTDMAAGMTKGLDAMAGAFLKNAVYEFMDGGKCKITVLGLSSDGTYEQSADKKTVTIVNSGKTQKHTIVTNTADELVLQSEDGSTMYFTAKK